MRSTASTSASIRFEHRGALDALRGLAVLLVVAFHAQLGLATGGYLGVSTFFTLSGFLIATLVLVEHARSGRVDLRAFWRRRVRRLLPAAVLVVAGVVVLVAVAGDGSAQARVGGDAWGALLYVANWRLLLGGTSYAELFSSPSPLVHTWSLAVEEQFYLVFPVVVALLSGHRRGTGRVSLRRRLGIVAGVTLVTSTLLPVLAGFGTDRAYYGTDSRAAEIAVGVLLAVVLFPSATRDQASGPLGTRARTVLAWTSTAALGAMAVVWATVPETSLAWRRGGFTLYALGSALLVAAGVHAVGPVGRLHRVRPLARLGVISYAVYLVHWPVLWLIGTHTDWGPVARLVVALLVSVGLAEVSLRLVENPIRRTGRVAGAPAALVLPVLVVVALAASGLVARDAPRPAIDFEAAAAVVSAPRDPQGAPDLDPTGAASTVAAPRELVVTFFGDSTALMTASGFELAAAVDPRVETREGVTELGGGIVLSRHARDARGTVSTPVEKCTRWPTLWPARAAELEPDVSVVQAGPWEAMDFEFDGVDGWHHLGDPEADGRARRYLEEVVAGLSSTGGRVAFLTTSHVDRRQPGPGPCECPERLDRWNELLVEVAAAHPDEVAVIDLRGWLDSLGGEDERLRPDGVHFSEATAAEVAERWLIDEVIAVARPRPVPPGEVASAPAGGAVPAPGTTS